MTDAGDRGGTAAAGRADDFGAVRKAIRDNLAELQALEGVLAIRPGYLFENGWITNRPAVVLSVDPEVLSDPQKLETFPGLADGVPIDLTPATPVEQLRGPEWAAGERAARGPAVKSSEDDLALPGWDASEAAPASRAVPERAARKPYFPPPGQSLAEVKDAMKITCHCSPDAGFAMLRPFLEGVKERLTVAMYDFSAPHIADSLQAAMENAPGDLCLNLDPKQAGGGKPKSGEAKPKGGVKANDIDEDDLRDQLAEALGDRFKFTWAAVPCSGKTTGGIFPRAYHIKVAVRDGKAFWLSSGNWQSSNQPDVDPVHKKDDRKGLSKFNREWNIVVEHPGLAKLYEKYILWDMEQAAEFQDEAGGRGLESPLPELLVPAEAEERAITKFFEPKTFTFTREKPLQVQPVLTPDNYADVVRQLIESAKKTIYFQNQYITVSPAGTKGFDALLDALTAKIKAGLDVKIILRSMPEARKMLEALQYRGFDASAIRLQASCHNKGIVVDSRVVALGSHNWSSEGTTLNRDATLVIHHPDVAAYYEEIFLHDWENQARAQTLAPESMPVVKRPGRASRRDVGSETIAWTDYYED